MIDPSELWEFDDPSGSERRFREAAGAAAGADRLVLLTQVARALGLQERFDQGHAVLDSLLVEASTAPAGPDEARSAAEVAVRIALERGRLLRSAGQPDDARPFFDEAVRGAADASLDAVQVDALHMLALVVGPQEQELLLSEALALATASTDPAARRWKASLLNNLGMTRADGGDFAAALPAFEAALAARTATGRPGEIRIARWMVAWALRNLGRTAEALAIQQALKAELEEAGEVDPYVDEELALLDGGPAEAS